MIAGFLPSTNTTGVFPHGVSIGQRLAEVACHHHLRIWSADASGKTRATRSKRFFSGASWGEVFWKMPSLADYPKCPNVNTPYYSNWKVKWHSPCTYWLNLGPFTNLPFGYLCLFWPSGNHRISKLVVWNLEKSEACEKTESKPSLFWKDPSWFVGAHETSWNIMKPLTSFYFEYIDSRSWICQKRWLFSCRHHGVSVNCKEMTELFGTHFFLFHPTLHNFCHLFPSKIIPTFKDFLGRDFKYLSFSLFFGGREDMKIPILTCAYFSKRVGSTQPPTRNPADHHRVRIDIVAPLGLWWVCKLGAEP